MNIYFVDYENVQLSGLNGIEKLGKNDKVVIFYSKNAEAMPLTLCDALSDSETTVVYVRNERIGMNSLDYQLSSFLGFMIGEAPSANFYIISKDTGFEAVLDFWNYRNVPIIRARSLAETPAVVHADFKLPPDVAEALKDEKFSQLELVTIARIMRISKTKELLHNNLMKNFTKDVRRLYGKLKNLI